MKRLGRRPRPLFTNDEGKGAQVESPPNKPGTGLARLTLGAPPRNRLPDPKNGSSIADPSCCLRICTHCFAIAMAGRLGPTFVALKRPLLLSKVSIVATSSALRLRLSVASPVALGANNMPTASSKRPESSRRATVSASGMDKT